MTKANTTDVTRVSLDFRVIPLSLYQHDYSSPLSYSGRVDHNLGHSYTDTRSEREWRGASRSAPDPQLQEQEHQQQEQPHDTTGATRALE